MRGARAAQDVDDIRWLLATLDVNTVADVAGIVERYFPAIRSTDGRGRCSKNSSVGSALDRPDEAGQGHLVAEGVVEGADPVSV